MFWVTSDELLFPVNDKFCAGWEPPKLKEDVVFVEGLVPNAFIVFAVAGVEPKLKPEVVLLVGLFVAPKLNPPLAGVVVDPKLVVVLGVDPKLKLDVEGVVLVFPKPIVVPRLVVGCALLPKPNPVVDGVVVEVFPNMVLVFGVDVEPNIPVFCVPGVLVEPKLNPFVFVAGVFPNALVVVLGVDPKLNPLVVAPGCVEPKPIVPNRPVDGWLVAPRLLLLFPKALLVFVDPNVFVLEPNALVVGCPKPGVLVVLPPNEKPPCCVLVAGVPPNRLFVVDVVVLPNMPPG